MAFESMFCFVMKKKSQYRRDARTASLSIKSIKGIDTSSRQRNTSFIRNFVESVTFLLFKLIGFIPCHTIRKFFYKYIFWMDISKNVVIYYGLEARSPWNISIGKGSVIGDKAILDARHGISIGENVNLSTGVWIWTLQHDVNSPSFSSYGTGGKVIIGNRAWISSRTTLLPGSNIAEGIVVAAGAVVTKPLLEPYTIWGGIPAQKISNRNKNLEYVFDGQHRWFI